MSSEDATSVEANEDGGNLPVVSLGLRDRNHDVNAANEEEECFPVSIKVLSTTIYFILNVLFFRADKFCKIFYCV